MLLPILPDCRLCELGSICKSPGLPVHHLGGTTGPVVCFLGHQPGLDEDTRKEVFTGPSGQLLRANYIKPLRLTDTCQVYLTNLVRCHPVGLDKPRPIHIKSCHGHLASDLSHLSTLSSRRYLILLGAEACKGLLDQSLSAALRNNCFEWSPAWLPSPWTVIVTYHPAFLLSRRNPNAIHAVADHLQLLLDQLSGVVQARTSPLLVPPGPPPRL